ncbi:MAG TPA: metallophosphoesterase, partial [Bdellovibrio sp.]|nr:metallophosphoesterase [Bdellovibrio sp.]
MSKLSTKLSLSVLVGIFLGACAQKPITYVGLIDEDKSFVKTVSAKGAACDSVTLESTDRHLSSLKLDRLTFDQASICQASLPKGTAIVHSSSGAINIAQKPLKIVVMGDTGCRLKNKDGKGQIQKCEDPKEWPFARLTHSVEKENADVIVHVGDYHYRESCTDPVKCKPYEGTLGYGFNAWEADFLKPADNILRQKPFIFVRGNHEDCHRAFEGFDKLLSPIGEDKCVEAQETRYTSFGNFLIVNFDNASVDDMPIQKTSAAMKSFRERYQQMVRTLESRPETEVWLVIHKPIWGLAPSYSGPGVVPVNINMRAVVEEMPLPKKVKMVFAGHIHAFQLATGNHPTEMVIGESGTALDLFSSEAQKTVPSGH